MSENTCFSTHTPDRDVVAASDVLKRDTSNAVLGVLYSFFAVFHEYCPLVITNPAVRIQQGLPLLQAGGSFGGKGEGSVLGGLGDMFGDN